MHPVRPTPPAPAGSPERVDARTRILDAATELLAQHGLRSLTQPRISRKSGLRQGHLTYYFPTRRDLMIGVAQHSLDALSQPLLARARRGRLTPAALGRALGAELADRGRVRIIMGLVSAAEDDPLIAAALHDLIARVRGKLADLFSLLGHPADRDSVALAHMMLMGAAVLHHARSATDHASAAGREVRLASRFVATLLPALHAGGAASAGARRKSTRKAHP